MIFLFAFKYPDCFAITHLNFVHVRVCMYYEYKMIASGFSAFKAKKIEYFKRAALFIRILLFCN